MRPNSKKALRVGILTVIFYATLNQRTSAQVAFAFDVTPTLLVKGAVAALVIGLLGGVLPAVQAARQPITSGLREL